MSEGWRWKCRPGVQVFGLRISPVRTPNTEHRERSDMKEIKAVIQPFMLDRVLDALHDIEGLRGITVSEVRAVSVERGHYEQIVKSKLEVMVPEPLVEVVLNVIQKH